MDARAFLDFHSTHHQHLREIYNGDSGQFHTAWSEEIEEVLLLLKMFPAKVKGKTGMKHNETFVQSVNKFISFSLVSTVQFLRIIFIMGYDSI